MTLEQEVQAARTNGGDSQEKTRYAAHSAMSERFPSQQAIPGAVEDNVEKLSDFLIEEVHLFNFRIYLRLHERDLFSQYSRALRMSRTTHVCVKRWPSPSRGGWPKKHLLGILHILAGRRML